jgi:hypothetical protein
MQSRKGKNKRRVGWTYSRNDIHSGHGINDREEKFTGNPRRLCRHEIKAAEGFESPSARMIRP